MDGEIRKSYDRQLNSRRCRRAHHPASLVEQSAMKENIGKLVQDTSPDGETFAGFILIDQYFGRCVGNYRSDGVTVAAHPCS